MVADVPYAFKVGFTAEYVNTRASKFRSNKHVVNVLHCSIVAVPILVRPHMTAWLALKGATATALSWLTRIGRIFHHVNHDFVQLFGHVSWPQVEVTSND